MMSPVRWTEGGACTPRGESGAGAPRGPSPRVGAAKKPAGQAGKTRSFQSYRPRRRGVKAAAAASHDRGRDMTPYGRRQERILDRKSTRLNSSHVKISYAVFCLKKQ